MSIKRNRTVLCIPDLHIPFEHPQALRFCKRIYDHFKCTDVVFIGDLVDNHAISYHEHDPNGRSPADEMQEADKHLVPWFKTFPKALVCLGNHDKLVDRKGKTVGLPARAFRPYREIWNLPEGWKDEFEHKIDGVKYIHGTNYSGSGAYLKAAQNNMCNTVMGHLHSVCGIGYVANDDTCIWGMSIGSLIDRHTYAFAYGKEDRNKPILACGIVEYTPHGPNPRLFKMDLEAK